MRWNTATTNFYYGPNENKFNFTGSKGKIYAFMLWAVELIHQSGQDEKEKGKKSEKANISSFFFSLLSFFIFGNSGARFSDRKIPQILPISTQDIC